MAHAFPSKNPNMFFFFFSSFSFFFFFLYYVVTSWVLFKHEAPLLLFYFFYQNSYTKKVAVYVPKSLGVQRFVLLRTVLIISADGCFQKHKGWGGGWQAAENDASQEHFRGWISSSKSTAGLCEIFRLAETGEITWNSLSFSWYN